MNLLVKIRRIIRRNRFYNIKKLKTIIDKPISIFYEERNYLFYTIEKDEEGYIVFRIRKTFNAIGFRPIYSGTYKECKKYCKDHKIEIGRRIYE